MLVDTFLYVTSPALIAVRLTPFMLHSFPAQLSGGTNIYVLVSQSILTFKDLSQICKAIKNEESLDITVVLLLRLKQKNRNYSLYVKIEISHRA